MFVKYFKSIRYIKFALAILFFELILGEIFYQYGYARGEAVYGIWSMYTFAAYALIYIVICLCQGWRETSLKTNIISTVYLGVPFLTGLILVILQNDLQGHELFYGISMLTLFGLTFILEIAILVLTICEDVIVKRKFKAKQTI